MIRLQDEIKSLQHENKLLREQSQQPQPHSMTVNVNNSKIKTLFKFYTGFCYSTFLAILTLLIPTDMTLFDVMKPTKYCRAMKTLSPEDQLFFVLCKLRNAFSFIDLAFRYNISVEDASLLFKNWINFMYFTFISIPIWPHRDIIVEHMPPSFRNDFPTTLIIIDGTELKIQKPSSLLSQSQTYSEYKSANTFKGLIGIDPRGSVIFISPLFSGSISDKQLCHDCGLLNYLQELLAAGHVLEGDAVMADKGFLIRDELNAIGLGLNIPPFSHGCQFTDSEVKLTRKIAGHRVHVERAISRIKKFKILSHKLDISLMASINQIWFTAAFLTNFMPLLIKTETDK